MKNRVQNAGGGATLLSARYPRQAFSKSEVEGELPSRSRKRPYRYGPAQAEPEAARTEKER